MVTTSRFHGIGFIVPLFLLVGICRADERGDPLQGNWTGAIHKNVVIRTECHQAVYDSTFELTFVIDRAGALKGHGTGHIASPSIAQAGCSDHPFNATDWTATYSPPTFAVSVEGYITNDRKELALHITPSTSLEMDAHYVPTRGSPYDEHVAGAGVVYVPSSYIPIQKGAEIGAFSLQVHQDAKDNLGIAQSTDEIYASEDGVSSDVLIDGNFSRPLSPAKKAAAAAAALLAALAALLAAFFATRVGQVMKGLFGMAVNAIGLFAGIGAFLIPGLGFTQALGAFIAIKSLVGLGLNAMNTVNALRGSAGKSLPNSLAEWTAEHFWPENAKALGVATVLDMGTDLGYAVAVRAALSGALGMVYPSSTFGHALERVAVSNPTELGERLETAANTFTGLDIFNSTKNVLSKLFSNQGTSERS